MRLEFSADGRTCIITGLDEHVLKLVKDIFSQIHQSSAGEVGIGTSEPETRFHVAGDSLFRGALQLESNTLSLRYANLKLFGPTSGTKLDCREDSATNLAALRANAAVIDGLNQFQFNVGDESICPGGVNFNVYKGDGSSAINSKLSGNANSYLNALAGNLGIGTINPLEKLHVNGVIRATSLKLGATPSAWTWATAAPTTGTWARADIVWHRSPVAAGNVGWICTAAGTPGTWKTFGAIAM